MALFEVLSCNYRRRTDVHWCCRLGNKSGRHSAAKQRTVQVYRSGRHSAAKERTVQVYIQEWQILGREAEDSSGLYTGVADTRPRSRGQFRFIYRSGKHSARSIGQFGFTYRSGRHSARSKGEFRFVYRSGRHLAAKKRTVQVYIHEWLTLGSKQRTVQVYIQEWQTLGSKQRTVQVYIQEWQHSAAKQRTVQVYIQEWQTLGREAQDNPGLYTGVADTRPRSTRQLWFIYRSGRHSAAKHKTTQAHDTRCSDRHQSA